MSNFGRIGVLAGGPSSERDISLRSGKAVFKALGDEKLDVIFLDVYDDIYDIIKKNKIDVAFIALHGKFGEDGTVQDMLEKAGIPYTGSGVEASRLALDKIASKEAFMRAGISVPEYAVYEKDSPIASGMNKLGWPIVVKPQFEGSSIGLSVVKDKDMLGPALDKAFSCGDKVLLEEYITGRELTVGILGDKPLPVIEIVTRNKVYDNDAKYKDPETKYLVPAPIERSVYKRVQDVGAMAHKALGCKFFSRVDVMADDSGNTYVLEVNTIPGMTERSLLPKAAQATGISFTGLCLK
ncbi:MAG: D-alanine--D-alanine ligase, partial [Candidatus Omnitrophota bacterium]